MADAQAVDQTLPAMVRAKYPGVYDDLSDTELDAKVRAKFPGAYDDVKPPTAVFRQSDQTPNDVDPNTFSTYVKHLWDGVNPVSFGQMLPFPKALGGSGMDNPLNPVKIVNDLAAVKKDADARLKKGDYVGAFAKYVESVVPIFGPMLSHQGDEWQSGHYAAAAGDATALAANVAGGKGMNDALAARYPLTNHPAASRPAMASDVVQFAQDRKIPLDAATVSDNLAVKGTQAIADRTLGGSLVATPANEARAAAMTRVGGELADEARPSSITPEQAGSSVRAALENKIRMHDAVANTAYEQLRWHEQNLINADYVPVEAAQSQAWIRAASSSAGRVPTAAEFSELRRIHAELDSMPFVKRTFTSTEDYTHAGRGNAHGYDIAAGAAGAPVYHDIMSETTGTSDLPRSAVRDAVKEALDTGKFNPTARAALEVAKQRIAGNRSLSPPSLPPSAGEVPVKTEAMLMPVDLRQAKQLLKPVYDQITRQYPLTQQQSSFGLKALSNIVGGPDFAPLSQVDTDLGAIKSLARGANMPELRSVAQGQAALAVKQLDAAVQAVTERGGPAVVKALQEGRQATIAKYAASDVLDTLHDEPVRAVKALTAPKDSAIQSLRAVTQQVPEQTPVLARAYLEDLLEKPQAVAEWRKLGSQTKAILFPKAGQTLALDQFFALTDRMSKTNVNPSGSGYVAALGAQGAMLWYDPFHAVPLQIGAAALAKLLRSPAAVNVLTRGMALPSTAPAAIKAAAVANVVKAARGAGVVLDFPKAADQGTSK